MRSRYRPGRVCICSRTCPHKWPNGSVGSRHTHLTRRPQCQVRSRLATRSSLLALVSLLPGAQGSSHHNSNRNLAARTRTRGTGHHRRTYAGWPAFHKLELVDDLMSSVRGQRPPVRNRLRIEPIEKNTRTLADHYRRKLARHRHYRRGLADELLCKIFSSERTNARAPRACTFLRALKPRMLARIAHEAGVELYTVQQIHRMVIERSETLKLFLQPALDGGGRLLCVTVASQRISF